MNEARLRRYNKYKPNYFKNKISSYKFSSNIRKPKYKPEGQKLSKAELKSWSNYWDKLDADKELKQISMATFVKNTHYSTQHMKMFPEAYKFYKSRFMYVFEFEGVRYYFKIYIEKISKKEMKEIMKSISKTRQRAGLKWNG